MSGPQLIVALDVDGLDEVRRLVAQLSPTVRYFKVGKQLFTRVGPPAVAWLKQAGCQVFLDLKFHDIPNTVAQAVAAGVASGADMVNVHASGGRDMIAAAATAARRANPATLLVAVTVLTSMDQVALAEIGLDVPPEVQVVRLAKLARDAGAHGVVASAHESALVRRECGPDFVQVIRGIRPVGAAVQDQKRVMTPAAAAAAGVHFVVVGRPITGAADPAAAAAAIAAELQLGAKQSG